ncbi:MAG TPA: deoxyribodipyrimidine photo-lyase [Steroidobacteraceae bacterium]|nr:deoxyribodipyrimidine photo-lyase [Steroidobacteraceae bacterium]
MPHRTLLWFRQDLRLADNPALHAAQARGAVIPVYLWTPQEEGGWQPGAASRWWLHHSLNSLAADIAARGGELLVRASGEQGALQLLQQLLRETGADGVCWNRRYEPAAIARDQHIKHTLRAAGLWVESFNGALLEEPWEVRNKAGKPFQVFTPYWKRAVQVIDPPAPLPPPVRWPGERRDTTARPPSSAAIDALELLPRIRWDAGMEATWRPGESGAATRLAQFLAGPVRQYDTDRNRPDLEGTSRLSAHLHFGEISPRQVWHAAAQASLRDGARPGAQLQWQFLTEIGWREFAHHLLFHFPHTPAQPLRAEFAHFPWEDDEVVLRAWQQGRTGIPIVDAGMRQLWHEGWMHNRVRMIVGSLLVKNLQVNWLHGARWFWDTLVDADLASNTLGWQWVAGCGADAAPFFRIFNPETQQQKFDPDGAYVRRWVPEAGDARRYPPPVVNVRTSRITALAAYEQMKRAAGPRT